MSIGSGFWFLAGALCATAVWLLLGRSWQGLRTQSRWWVGGGALAVLAALALYSQLGSPQLLTAGGSDAAAAGVAPAHPGSGGTSTFAAGGSDAGSMDGVVATLEQRLRAQGGGDGDWELLAKSYEFLKRTDAAALARAHRLPDATAASGSASASTPAVASSALQSAAAPRPTADSARLLAQADAARRKRDFKEADRIFGRLAAREQMTAQSWADYADVAASLNGDSLNGKPMEYVRRALQLDPAQPKALWLQGTAEHEIARYAAAVETWRKLLAAMDASSSDAQLIRANIEEDTRLASAAVAPTKSSAAKNGLTVRGEVTVSQRLQSRVRAGQVLYIVAKSVNAPGMPVAVRRVTTGTWPVGFELSDSDAMIPERRLSSVGPVTVEARISQSGQANSAPGDLLGATAPLDPAKAGALHLVIDREVH